VQAADKLDHVSFYSEADPVVADPNTIEAACTANLPEVWYLVERLGRFDSFDTYAYSAQ
jgi:hypothetical protein